MRTCQGPGVTGKEEAHYTNEKICMKERIGKCDNYVLTDRSGGNLLIKRNYGNLLQYSCLENLMDGGW